MVSHLLPDLEKFEEELSREHYLHSSGQKDESESAKIYAKYPQLFSKEHIKEAAKNMKTREGKLLYDAFVGNFVGNELKEISDEMSSFESAAEVEFEGKKLAFRQASSVLVNEPVREKRKKLYESLKPVKSKLTKYEKGLWDECYKLIHDLSGKSYLDYVSFIKEVDYDALAKELKEFLVKTESLHKSQLEKNMSTVGVKLEDTMPYDYAFFARAKPFDEFFKKENLVPLAKSFWKGLGFDIDKQKNVILDVEEREKKVPRAFCMPVKVPQEVILVIKPHGGQDDYQSFLHESGHTEHFANTDSKLSYELKHMGAHSVSETYAFLIEYLMANPLFLQKCLNLPEKAARDFSVFMMETKLQAFRRYAAKIIYELKLHRNDLTKLDARFENANGSYKDASEMYVDILTKATKIKYQPEGFLLDVDGGMYSADYVRAWIFESMVRKKLEEKFGTDWFQKKEAGVFLKGMWKFGSSGKSCEELAQMIGYGKLDISVLTKDFLDFFGKR